ncbi:MAG: SH3 domain-containing protein [Deltaproteobacteria bacterium]|nr:SH3 domain-containing protein [Deltaproteobacteria bacterium]
MKRTAVLTWVMVLFLAGQVQAGRFAVSVGKANVRSGPGTDYDILWSAGKYYPVDTLKRSGNWYQIRDFEGDEGWIFHRLLAKIPAVIVKVPLANVRQGPGTKTAILFQAEKGVSFKRIGKKGAWLKVQHADGDIGWIHHSLVWGQ